jgi:hypothetical protein
MSYYFPTDMLPEGLRLVYQGIGTNESWPYGKLVGLKEKILGLSFESLEASILCPDMAKLPVLQPPKTINKWRP